MSGRIEWVSEGMRLLGEVREDLSATRPFDGMTIGTGIHLEPKTAALLLALVAGGARVVATGNLSSTQPATVDYLRARGVEVFATETRDAAEHDESLRTVLAERPDLLLDNGGDLFLRWLDDPYDGLRGGTEETTSGRNELLPHRSALRMPILVINDSPIKQFAENTHAVGQSVFESYLRLTNRSTQGKRVVVFGYGSCGRGVAAVFRNAFALVTVLEADPVKRLEASLDGFDVADRETALSRADVVITVTGARNVLRAADLPLLRDDVILANAGHFPREIDVAEMRVHPDVVAIRPSTPGLETLECVDGRRIHIAAEGHMVNLAGPSPLGNSFESMDLGFALQALCLAAVARGEATAEDCVVPVPRRIDEAVAAAYLRLVARVV